MQGLNIVDLVLCGTLPSVFCYTRANVTVAYCPLKDFEWLRSPIAVTGFESRNYGTEEQRPTYLDTVRPKYCCRVYSSNHAALIYYYTNLYRSTKPMSWFGFEP